MSDSLSIIDPLAYPRWDELLLASGDHSFFHTASWARVLHESYGYKPVYLTAMEGSKLTLLVPLMEVNSFLTGRRGVSLPFSDFCEPFVAEGAPPLGAALDKAIEEGKKAGWKYIELRDGRYKPTGPSSDCFYVHDLDLVPGADVLFSRLRDSTRRNIRKAKKAGVEVRRETSLEAARIFYRLNCRTRREHGLPPQPFSFFMRVAGHIFASGSGFMALAFHRGKPIAGAIFFHFGQLALFKYGASENRFQHLRANNLVMWEAIRWLAEDDFRGLSFGRTETSNAGLLQFKRGFGADEKTIHYLRYDLVRREFTGEQRRTNGHLAGIITKMPLGVLRVAGAFLYRHIG